MEILRETTQEFLKLDDCYRSSNGYGYGYGSGSGDGYGSGYGYGYGSGSGYGYGDGYGSGDGSGSGSGSGDGYGYGSGSGSGDGYGYGSGSGDGSGYGISKINGYDVYKIDGQQTIITAVMGNTAKGFLLQNNVYLKPCYVVKNDGYFAHGYTLREAREALREKVYANLDTKQVIAEFKEKFELDTKYPAMEFYHWHHYLTGSCAAGRQNFAVNHGINLDEDTFTVKEFIEITRNDYGGDIIKELSKAYEIQEAD